MVLLGTQMLKGRCRPDAKRAIAFGGRTSSKLGRAQGKLPEGTLGAASKTDGLQYMRATTFGFSCVRFRVDQRTFRHYCRGREMQASKKGGSIFLRSHAVFSRATTSLVRFWGIRLYILTNKNWIIIVTYQDLRATIAALLHHPGKGFFRAFTLWDERSVVLKSTFVHLYSKTKGPPCMICT